MCQKLVRETVSQVHLIGRWEEDRRRCVSQIANDRDRVGCRRRSVQVVEHGQHFVQEVGQCGQPVGRPGRRLGTVRVDSRWRDNGRELIA